jgi:hypothetical protein
MIREPSSAATVDRQADRDGPVMRLLELCAGARPFRGTDGHCYAVVDVCGRREVYSIRSTAFREWLTDGCLRQFGKVPSDWSIRRVRHALEATARFALERPKVCMRVSEYGGRYYLDLADHTGRAVEITAEGWRIVDSPPVTFYHPDGQLALPEPSRDGSLELLRPYLNVDDPDFWLSIMWELAALRPTGPYPILELTGPPGVGKSTAVRILRDIIDPTSFDLLSDPRNTHELMAATLFGWVQAYNNISRMPTWFSDGLCILSTGGAIALGTSLATGERTIIQAQRPTILNGTEELLLRSDADDRKISVELRAILDDRRCEGEFWSALSRDQPGILGGLLNAWAGGMRALANVRIERLPRMADFAVFAEAVGRGLGWPAGKALSLYNDNRKQAASALFDHSPVAGLLVDFARHLNGWTGTATDLLDKLAAMAGRRTVASAQWPKSPRALTVELRRLSTLLGLHDITVTFHKTTYARFIRVSTPDCPDDQQHRDDATVDIDAFELTQTPDYPDDQQLRDVEGPA